PPPGVRPGHATLTGRESTSERRLELEYIEEVRADGESQLGLRCLITLVGEAADDDVIGKQAGEGLCALSQVDVVGIRDAAVAGEEGVVRAPRDGADAHDV